MSICQGNVRKMKLWNSAEKMRTVGNWNDSAYKQVVIPGQIVQDIDYSYELW